MEMTPDVVAPGDDILAAGYSSGGDTRTGYNVASGTSMACPHVSGAAAIILQHHPEFTPAEVRSALMSTAEYKGVTRLEDGEAAQPLDMGAGRIDLRKAIDPALLFDPPKVDFSLCPRNGNYTQKVTVSKYRSGDMTVSVKIVKHTARNVVEPVDSRIDADPSVFTLTDENPEVVISFMLDAEELDLGDQNAFVVFEDEGTGAEIAHIPLWGQVVCSDDEKKDVLLVVLDQTKCISGLTDTNITDIYTSTLDEMSLTYDIFEYCNDKTFKTLFRLPEKAVGLCYKAVIIAASQTNPSSISSAEGDVRRMMHAGVPVIQMGGTLGKAWGINGEKWETKFIMENEFGVGSPGPWSSEKWINVVDVDVLPGTSMPKLNQNEVDVMYSTDNGDVLIVTQKYQSTGFLYFKTFNSVGITSVVGLDHFVPSSRVGKYGFFYFFSLWKAINVCVLFCYL